MNCISKYATAVCISTLMFDNACHAVERVYVAAGESVHTYDLAGNLLVTLAVGDRPSDIAVNELGEIFTLTRDFGAAEDYISKFGPDGTPLGTIITIPQQTTRLLLGLEVGGDDHVYVGRNSDIDTIERYTQNGTFVDFFATVPTTGPGAPFAIVFDSLGKRS